MALINVLELSYVYLVKKSSTRIVVCKVLVLKKKM